MENTSNDDDDVWGGEEGDLEFLFLSQLCELKTTHQSDIPPLGIQNGGSVDIGRMCTDRLSELPKEDPNEKYISLENKYKELLSKHEQVLNESYRVHGESNIVRKNYDDEKMKRRTEIAKLTQAAELERQKHKKEMSYKNTQISELKNAQMKEGLKFNSANKRTSNGELVISSQPALSLTPPQRQSQPEPTKALEIKKEVQSIEIQVCSSDLVPIDQRDELLKEKCISLAVQNVGTLWEENLFELESTAENVLQILQSLADENCLRPQGSNPKLASKTLFFRAALERRGERAREGLPSFVHPDLKMPNEFGPGIFHRKHDEILKELLAQTSPFHGLQYIRIFIKTKFFDRFRGLDILGIYHKTHFLSFLKLFIWAKEIWNLLLNSEKQGIVDLKLSTNIQPQTLVGELCKWTFFILESESRNFLTVPFEVLFRSTSLSIFESIIELGYFDHRTKCYLKLEKLILHTLDTPYHSSSSSNVQSICKIIGMLASKDKIFSLLCKSKNKNKAKSKSQKCLCIDLGCKVKNIIQDEQNRMTTMERIDIFLAYMEMLNNLKSPDFIEVSSIGREWNQTHCNHRKENKSTENIDEKEDLEIRAAIFNFNPPNPVLSGRINEILTKTEEELEEEKDKVKLIVHWDSNANANANNGDFDDSQLFSEVSQVVIPCGKKHREHKPHPDPDDDMFAEESMEIVENENDEIDDLQNLHIDSDEDWKSWLSPFQWENRQNNLRRADRKRKTIPCQCRKSFVSSTISMIHTLIQIWEADYHSRVSKNEILFQNTRLKSEKMTRDSKGYCYDDFPLSLLKIEEEERGAGPELFNAILKMNNGLKTATLKSLNSPRSRSSVVEKVKLDPNDITVIEESSEEDDDEENKPKKGELEEKILNSIIKGVKFLIWIYAQSENVGLVLGSEGTCTFVKTLSLLQKAFRKGLKIDQVLEWKISDFEEEFNKSSLFENDLPIQIQMMSDQWNNCQVYKVL